MAFGPVLMMGLVACLCFFTSCKKKEKEAESDSLTQNTADPTPASLNASMNGKNWTATNFTATLAVDTKEEISEFQMVAETGEDKLYFQVGYETILSSPQTGNFALENSAFMWYVNKSKFDAYAPEKVNITITNVNSASKKVSGTFSYIATQRIGPNNAIDSLKVTGGTFKNVPYTITNEDL